MAHKCSAQIYSSVHTYISQCTNISFQCTGSFFFLEHKHISQCKRAFLSEQIYFSVSVLSIKSAETDSVRENAFQFNKQNYLQTNRTTKGTKMAVAFANIFNGAEIEKQILKGSAHNPLDRRHNLPLAHQQRCR